MSERSLRNLAGLIVLVLFMTGCAHVADMDMADRAMAAGRADEAAKHYRTLAKFGVPEAQIKLADYLVERGQWQTAEQWYLAAEKSGDQRAWGRLGQLYQRHAQGRLTVAQAAAHQFEQAAAHGDDSVADNLLELYLDFPSLPRYAGLEPLIEQRMNRGDAGSRYLLVRYYQFNGQEQARRHDIVRLCREALDVVYDCYPLLADLFERYPDLGKPADLQQHMQQRWQQQQLQASDAWKFARWFIASERVTPQPKISMQLLKMIDQEYPRASSLEADLMRKNPALGNTTELLSILQRGREQASAEAEYMTGLIYFEGRLVAADPQLAEQHLLKASGEVPQAHFYLGRLYRLGHLGRANPQKAVQHYLLAGRRGSAKAYFELSRYFLDGVGIGRNLTYAYGFAQLSSEAGYQRATTLLHEISGSISGDIVVEGQKVAERERQAMQTSVLLQTASGGQES
ncbi:tetratricopeptide repeat protein [Gynuella sunshinyii]|uniref:TPR repeat, SEL1 subfamily n=1 Tax=Gynuella sunshinyii YC6258 TaxID=1445510 RepID=A0A0C5VFP9_9GAMM|nr:SEL1-like repeat protein [Gynuella sunshinyii]AJQ93016.1 TPR repeat, SEL1 subfamily [Gynuella sunshinyii YC6258]